MSRSTQLRAGAVVLALVLLAMLTGRASPGFSAEALPGSIARSFARAIGASGGRSAPALAGLPGIGASGEALGDIPPHYLALYVRYAATCAPLTWQLLAGIGKVESDHGRDPARGVHNGTNPAGAAGPMQFLLPTWALYGQGNPYDPADAIPATARMLCADGLQALHPHDPCPTTLGPPQAHQAIHAYNHACWYVHAVLTWAIRYTTAPPPPPDPYTLALAANPRLATTTSRGCDPAPDLVDARLDLRVLSVLAVVAERWSVRISCLHTGHSYYVKGTHRVSNHTVWRAVDLDQVDGHPVDAHNPDARALAAWLDRLQGPLRPVEVGSPWDFGHRPYFTDSGHKDHIHLGYGPDPCQPQPAGPQASAAGCE